MHCGALSLRVFSSTHGHYIRTALLSARVLSVFFVLELGPSRVPLWRKDGGCLCGGCRCCGHDGTVVKTLPVLVAVTLQIATKGLGPYPLVLVTLVSTSTYIDIGVEPKIP